MRPVEFHEIRNIAEYELARRDVRPRLMALKERRRVRVGDHLTFLFENRETVWYQIQEMMRIERIVEEGAIRHELATYNVLIPAPNELSASLLIEYESPEERAVRLHDLLGLEEHVWLAVGDLAPVKARFDTRQMSAARISSVQYLKFYLEPEHVARFRQGARIVVDHPAYRAEAALTPEQLEELARDFDWD